MWIDPKGVKQSRVSRLRSLYDAMKAVGDGQSVKSAARENGLTTKIRCQATRERNKVSKFSEISEQKSNDSVHGHTGKKTI
jgi:hypothetical protein